MSEIVSEPRPPNFFTEFDDNDDDDVLAIQVRRGGLLITDALIVDERVCFTASDLHMQSSWYYLCNTEQVTKMMVVSCSEPGTQQRAQEEQTYIFL